MNWPLAISIVALSVSILGLLWQRYTFRQSGPVISVRCGRDSVDLDGYHHDCIVITATNKGRLQTVVERLGFQLPGKRDFEFRSILTDDLFSPSVLAPGDSVSFYIEPGDVRRFLEAETLKASDLKPFAVSGHSREVGKPLDTL